MNLHNLTNHERMSIEGPFRVKGGGAGYSLDVSGINRRQEGPNPLVDINVYQEKVVDDSSVPVQKYDPSSSESVPTKVQINRAVNACREKYEGMLYYCILNEVIEVGSISTSQTVFQTVIDEYGIPISARFILDFFRRWISNSKITISILYILANLMHEEAVDIGWTVAAASLANRNHEVVDFALQCFDSWDDPGQLGFLQACNTGVPYLEDYKASIIRRLMSKVG